MRKTEDVFFLAAAIFFAACLVLVPLEFAAHSTLGQEANVILA